ncbi:MAG: hypothetical protein ACREEH_03185, partial [Caulobacteraceae bacterium]
MTELPDHRAITRSRFIHILEAWGADPARWPADERQAALRLAAEPEFADLIRKESRLDAALDLAGDAAPFPALRARIISAARQAGRPGEAAAWGRRFGLGLGLAAACAAGVVLGAWGAPVALRSGPAHQESSD